MLARLFISPCSRHSTWTWVWIQTLYFLPNVLNFLKYFQAWVWHLKMYPFCRLSDKSRFIASRYHSKHMTQNVVLVWVGSFKHVHAIQSIQLKVYSHTSQFDANGIFDRVVNHKWRTFKMLLMQLRQFGCNLFSHVNLCSCDMYAQKLQLQIIFLI